MALVACRSEAPGTSLLKIGTAEADTGLVMTSRESNVMQSLVPWLQSETPLLLVGPEGCGKAVLMHHCLSQLVRTQVS